MALRPRFVPIALVISAFTWVGHPSARGQSLDEAVGGWARAVGRHTPGTLDGAVVTVWAMTPTDRLEIEQSLPIFLSALDGALDSAKSSHEAQIIVTIAADLYPLTSKTFLERAATLHADAVMFDRRGDAPVPARGVPTKAVTRSEAIETPGLRVSALDGEFKGTSNGNPNWPFARLLLDALGQKNPNPSSRTFSSTWYQGVTAFLLANGNFADAEASLKHGVQMLPEDAELEFELGCVSEGLGMNVAQQVTIDDHAPGVWLGPGRGSIPVELPSAKTRNSEAASHYRRAIALDPHLAEAHVRLARLLQLDQHWAEADREIAAGLANHPDRVIAFYAHLLGARGAAALGHADDAEAHVGAALMLYPEAESAHLAGSYSSLRRGDGMTASSRVAGLATELDAPPGADPWRAYPIGPGRAPRPPLVALWSATPPGR